MALNRDTSDFGLNSIGNNLLKSDKVKFISPETFSLCPIVSSNITSKPEPGRSRRFAFSIAVRKK